MSPLEIWHMRMDLRHMHLSQRAAMVRFTETRPEESKAEIEDIDPDAPHESEEKET